MSFAEPATRKTMALPDSMWAEINAYRRVERITTEVEAVRRLVLAGLRTEEKQERLRIARPQAAALRR